MTVETTDLGNGLRVVTDSMDTVETVSIGTWVEAGTRHEKPEINGVSHLLEHMAFKGTKRRSALQIAEEIEAVGGHLNAYTSRENTAYYAKVLKEDANLALDIMSDILQHSTFDQEELERERTVILQEINQANDTPDDIIFDKFQETAFPNQAIGRPVLGLAKLVQSMPRETVIDYMKENYSAPRIIVAASGKVDHEAVVRMAEEKFVDLPESCEFEMESAKYVGGKISETKDLEQVQMLLGFAGISYTDPDYYSLSVLSAILGGGMSSRLFQEVREKRGLVYSIYAFGSCYMDSGIFGIYAGTGGEEMNKLMPVICDELLKVRDHISDEELARARTQLKASILMSLESTASRCEQLARQMILYDRPLPVAEVVEKIEAVDIEAVLRVAQRVTSSTPTLATIGPLGDIDIYDDVVKALR